MAWKNDKTRVGYDEYAGYEHQYIKEKQGMSLISRCALAMMVASSVALSGCATVVTSNDISFPVKSKPSRATVIVHRVNGSAKTKAIAITCITPCHLTLRQTHSYLIKIKKSGYKSFSKEIKSDGSIEGFGGSLAGNLLVGGPVGLIVDGVSGADDRLFPGHITVKLVPKKSNTLTDAKILTFKKVG